MSLYIPHIRDVKSLYIPEGYKVTLPPSYEGKSLYQGRKVTLPPLYEGKPLYQGFLSLILINCIRLGNKTTYYHIFGIIQEKSLYLGFSRPILNENHPLLCSGWFSFKIGLENPR